MTIVDQNHKVTLDQLTKMAEKTFGNFVKAVVDTNRGIMAVDADLHADQKSFLLDQGAKQEHLWGINLHPDQQDISEFVEFNSMINLRPSHNNRSRGVDDPKIRERIIEIVNQLVIQT